MKRTLLIMMTVVSALWAGAADIFVYSPEDGKGGLRFAVKEKDGSWRRIGDGYDFLKSDFGTWGAQKKMWSPQLFQNNSGEWVCLFRTIANGSVVGMAESKDLLSWKPQKYLVSADTARLEFRKNQKFNPSVAEIEGVRLSGNEMTMDDSLVASLEAFAAKKKGLAKLYSEHCDGDTQRFAGLQPVSASLKTSGKSKKISDMLMGIFFEDINYAADGGLYAELVQNRDFEYVPGEGRDKEWGPKYAWSVKGNDISFTIEDENPISKNNPHFARLKIGGGVKTLLGNDAFVNSGYDGIPLKKGEPYRFRFKARGSKIPLDVNLVAEHGRKVANAKVKLNKTTDWTTYEVILTPDEHASAATLEIVPRLNGTIDLDMVSLFPVNTYKKRENGLRADLAEALAALKPRFVRFPGGCVAHGNGIDNIYDWKGSIGKLEDRKPLFNLWGYHQTRGLGYHEYFQFCEDIGAEPLPVLAAGVPCQNSSHASRFSHDELTTHGQQCGIPMDSMGTYIQDILDLIEYANGPATSVWGAKRAEAGHPEPFNLKYIGIGNEDMITEVFEERFCAINNAVKKAYPEITVVGTVGPFYEGSDYDAGWELARRENIDMVDEHYYVDPAWLVYNQDYYDNYDRNGTKVYLGEWAAHLPGRPSNMETALAEALYLTAVERNADVVSLSSYAPLLAKDNHTQWRPDLIYFNNTEVKPTTDYETMRLYGENGGDIYLDNVLDTDSDNDKVKARVAASVVKDSKSGDVIVKLVNLLPVETTVDVDITSEIPGENPLQSVRTVMTGTPSQSKASVKTDRVGLPSGHFLAPLPAYSFTIIRIKK